MENVIRRGRDPVSETAQLVDPQLSFNRYSNKRIEQKSLHTKPHQTHQSATNGFDGGHTVVSRVHLYGETRHHHSNVTLNTIIKHYLSLKSIFSSPCYNFAKP